MTDVFTSLGNSSFADIRKKNLCYVDKTAFIARLLQVSETDFSSSGQPPAVTLLTRPRRFGKTLLMSTLAEFFDIAKNSVPLFEGLEITRYTSLCRAWMNQYPVLVITLKDLSQNDFQSNLQVLLSKGIIPLVKRLYPIIEGGQFVFDREYYDALLRLEVNPDPGRLNSLLQNVLSRLIGTLYEHYGKQVIVLIDEYDVPLSAAQRGGFYAQMLPFMRSFLSCLKDNPELNFAVLTGCLRLSKESLFTGLNNFNCNTVYDAGFADCCGFTLAEVRSLVSLYGLEGSEETLIAWYDGYIFGRKTHIFSPWDVLSYLNEARVNRELRPRAYWANTASTDEIRAFLSKYRLELQASIEQLFAGTAVFALYDEKITYNTLFDGLNNFWMLLYYTGYVTLDNTVSTPAGQVALRFPNEEIREIFSGIINEVNADVFSHRNLTALYADFFRGESSGIGEKLTELLFDTISYYDYRESFYHAFVVGLFAAGQGMQVRSNPEAGLGRPDIVVVNHALRQVIIIECKKAVSDSELQSQARLALEQIELRRYAKLPWNHLRVTRVGLAFHGKHCAALSS